MIATTMIGRTANLTDPGFSYMVHTMLNCTVALEFRVDITTDDTQLGMFSSLLWGSMKAFCWFYTGRYISYGRLK